MKEGFAQDRRSIVCLFLISGSLLTALLFLAIQLRLLRVEALRDYGEGHTLWMSQQIADLAVAYKPLDALPYVIFPYPPLYLLISKLVSFATGNLLLAGRTVSLVSTYGLAAFIGLMVFQAIPATFPRRWRWAGSALGMAIVLTTGSVIGWASLMRVDMLGLMLMYGGLAFYIRAGEKAPGQYGAAIIFVLAAFTKQTLLSAPLACAVFGLFSYPKTTIQVFGLAALLGVSALFICNGLTEGGFLKNILNYNMNPFSWNIVVVQFSSHLRLNITVKLLLSVCALVALFNGKDSRWMGLKRFVAFKSRNLYGRTIVIGTINAVLAGLLAISIGKMGSIYNFFLAWDLALCLLAALYLFRLLATWRLNSRPTMRRPLVLLTLVLLLFIPSRWVISTVTEDFSAQIREEAQLLALIRATPGPVLSDNMLLITRAGRKIEAEPATLSFLTMAGGWDERPYLQLFERDYFSLIITTPLIGADRYSPATVTSIHKNYRQVGQIGHYLVYRPLAGRQAIDRLSISFKKRKDW